MLAGQPRDAWCSNDTGVLDMSAAILEPGCDGVGNPAGGLARIHTEQDLRVRMRSVELMGQGEADCVDSLRVKR